MSNLFFHITLTKKFLFFHFFLALLTRQIKAENFVMCMMMIAKDSFIQKKVFFSLVFYFSRHTFEQFSSYFYLTQNFTHIHSSWAAFFLTCSHVKENEKSSSPCLWSLISDALRISMKILKYRGCKFFWIIIIHMIVELICSTFYSINVVMLLFWCLYNQQKYCASKEAQIRKWSVLSWFFLF